MSGGLNVGPSPLPRDRAALKPAIFIAPKMAQKYSPLAFRSLLDLAGKKHA